MATLEVRLAVFAGPLDLLLHLIEREEVDIWQVSMAEIADQYIAFLEELHEVELDAAGEYLAMAALLVRIKARHLLPYVEPEEEEEEDEGDFEEALKLRLVEYKRYKEAAAQLGRLARHRARLYRRPGAGPAATPVVAPGPPANFTLSRLAAAFAELLAAAPPPPPRPPLLRKVDLPQKVREVRRRVVEAGDGLSFRHLFTPGASRWEWIVTFLAVLELVHKAEVVVRDRPGKGLCLRAAAKKGGRGA